MGLALGALAIGTTIAGGVMQAQAQRQQGKDQEAIMKYNAAVKEQEAKQIEAKAVLDSQRNAEQAERIRSSLRAKLGASGAVMSEGTPLLLQAKQASELEFDNLMIGYNANVDATRLRNGANIDRAQGKMYARAGSNAATATLMNTGGTVLGGLYDYGFVGNSNSFNNMSESQQTAKMRKQGYL